MLHCMISTLEQCHIYKSVQAQISIMTEMEMENTPSSLKYFWNACFIFSSLGLLLYFSYRERIVQYMDVNHLQWQLIRCRFDEIVFRGMNRKV